MQPSLSFGERIIGALKLDSRVYGEIASDSDATWQAAAIVAVSSILSDIGTTNQRGSELLVGGVFALFGWAFSALFTYIVGAYLLRAPSTSGSFDQVLRTLGFASAPAALIVLGPVRDFRNPILLIAYIWSIVASIVATRQSLSVGTGRAVAISIVAGLAQLFLVALIVTRLGIDITGFRSYWLPSSGS